MKHWRFARRESIYARARAIGALMKARWKLAPCRCCWVAPWCMDDNDESEWADEDVALVEIGWTS